MRLTLLVLLSQVLSAQQVAAPTPAPVGPPRGDEVSGYNVVNSFETGYRFSLIDGNLGKYRSDVNYRNGLRLLGSNLTVNSRDGHGGLFDEIVLNTLGLGNDPYQSAVLRIQKNRLYRYDMIWRLNEYYNPGLTVSFGEHFLDTRRRLQDHDLVLLPQSKLKFRVGYTRNSQTGPALSTAQVFDTRGDEFPLFTDVRRLRNEYRAGGDIEMAGFKLTWLRRWDNFKEDTPYFLPGPNPGNNPADLTALSRFRRAEPYHGSTPGWLANLRGEHERWAANGRFTYAGGRRSYVLDETAIGFDRFGAGRNRQVVVSGNARRPVTTGDFSLSLFPSEKITLINNTSVYSTRIDGDSAYREFNNATQTGNLLNFRFLGMRAIANSTDLHLRASGWLGFYAGYHFSTRRVRSIENDRAPPFPDVISTVAEQENIIHSGLFGVRLKPAKPLTLNLDGEIGRADRPFFPISERNYHAIGARAQYKVRNLSLSAGYRQNYNTNSVTLSVHGSRARDYNANASWAPRDWFALDAGYSKLHLDTVSGIAFFAGFPRSSLVEGRQSLYFSNIHAGNLGVRFGIRKRADLYAGYSITQDLGDARSGVTDPISAFLVPVQTFPLRFHSPVARLSLRLHPRVRWNAGWQFYRYREDFGLFPVFQNYRAHTGYTSLLWSF